MKSSICVLVFLISHYSFGQNEKIKDFVSYAFFGYDIMNKPEKIESRSTRPFDYGADPYDEKNIIKFSSHPLAKGNIKGQYNIKYLYEKDLFENYGVYELDMTLVFDSYKPAKAMLEQLKKMCRMNAEFKNENLGRENAPKSEECIYDYDEKLQLPRIVLHYSRGPHTIRIQVYTSYNFNKFKKYTNKLW
ncbi:hypothetical protein [Flavobacterium sp.]|uniref:hypothetical protein n=1 Tax=Flavobacterium sp. TaxID=239 RepID=UPI00286C6D93|nr:hypothetical protein [Flavobacterium sp.]